MPQKPQSQFWRTLLLVHFGLVSWVLAGAISLHEAVPPIRASLALLDVLETWEPAKDLEEGISKQRQIQTHYLSYGVYIPLDDIVVGAQDSRSQPFMTSVKGLCGPSSTVVWVPIAVHFPILGEKVFEWCLART